MTIVRDVSNNKILRHSYFTTKQSFCLLNSISHHLTCLLSQDRSLLWFQHVHLHGVPWASQDHTVICLNEEKIIITWMHPDSHRKWLELEILKGNWHNQRKMPPDEQDLQVPDQMLSEVLSFSMWAWSDQYLQLSIYKIQMPIIPLHQLQNKLFWDQSSYPGS